MATTMGEGARVGVFTGVGVAVAKGVSVEAGKGVEVDAGKAGCALHASRMNMAIKITLDLRKSVRNPHSSKRSN